MFLVYLRGNKKLCLLPAIKATLVVKKYLLPLFYNFLNVNVVN